MHSPAVEALIKRFDAVEVRVVMATGFADPPFDFDEAQHHMRAYNDRQKKNKKMDKFQTGTVVWPGKDWDNKPEYGGGKRTSSTFRLENGEEVKVNSSNPDSPKALFLKSMKKGDQIPLIYNKERGDIPAFWDVDAWALVGTGSPSAKKDGKIPTPYAMTKAEALAKAKERLVFFYREAYDGIAQEIRRDTQPPEMSLNAMAFQLMKLTQDILDGRA